MNIQTLRATLHFRRLTKVTKGQVTKGQAMIEFVIVIPVLILLIFGTIQIGFIYSAKTTLNYATFQAARLGAVNHATYSAMRRGLIRGLAPLYTQSADLDGVKSDIEAGYDSAGSQRDAKTEVDGYTRIIRLSPRASLFDDAGEENDDGIVEIPNDNLMYRSADPDYDGVSIQDGNLLKIRVQYCYKLMVPIVNKIIGGLSELNNTRPASDYHIHDTVGDPRFADRNRGASNDAASLFTSLASYEELCGGNSGVENRAANTTGFIISSEVIVRMQSAAMEEDDDDDLASFMCNGVHMVCP
ncbi:MAG: TadE/TadG family type IV pilus assembly protein [Pseudomonadota bacterium]